MKTILNMKTYSNLIAVAGLAILTAGCAKPWDVYAQAKRTYCSDAHRRCGSSCCPARPQIEVVPIAPDPALVWVPGYWSWRGSWIWVHGAWSPRPYGRSVWVEGRWSLYREHDVWRDGHWH